MSDKHIVGPGLGAGVVVEVARDDQVDRTAAAVDMVFVGVFVLGVGVSWLLEIRRRDPSEREGRPAIRTLWKLTRRIPAGRILVDPGHTSAVRKGTRIRSGHVPKGRS